MDISVGSHHAQSHFQQLAVHESEGNKLPDFLASFIQHSVILDLGAKNNAPFPGEESEIYDGISSAPPKFQDEYRLFQALSETDRSAFFSISFDSEDTRESFVSLALGSGAQEQSLLVNAAAGQESVIAVAALVADWKGLSDDEKSGLAEMGKNTAVPWGIHYEMPQLEVVTGYQTKDENIDPDTVKDIETLLSEMTDLDRALFLSMASEAGDAGSFDSFIELMKSTALNDQPIMFTVGGKQTHWVSMDLGYIDDLEGLTENLTADALNEVIVKPLRSGEMQEKLIDFKQIRDEGLSAMDKDLQKDFYLSGNESGAIRNLIRNGVDRETLKDIGELVSEMGFEDRSLFLELAGGAGDELGAFVHALKQMDEESRSMLLKAGTLIGPGDNLGRLADVAAGLSEKDMVLFLETTEELMQSGGKRSRGDVTNFLTAAASSPENFSSLIATTTSLDTHDRHLFLEAAAGAEKELGRLINTVDAMSGKELSTFLNAASKSGDGLAQLIDLTNQLDADDRTAFLSFAAALDGDAVEGFLETTEGAEDGLDKLMETLDNLTPHQQKLFLEVASRQVGSLDRMVDIVNERMGFQDRAGVTDFLSTAANLDTQLTDFLDMVENSPVGQQKDLLAFSSELSFVDLASFISAGAGDASAAGHLVETARQLEGQDRSYFLYAASQEGADTAGLSAISHELKGDDRRNFLYTAANAAGGLNTLVNTVGELSGKERADYLRHRSNAVAGERGNKAAEYVYLNAAFERDTVDTILNASQSLERIISKLDALDTGQRDAVVSVTEKTGSSLLSEVVSIVGKLDDDGMEKFVKTAESLTGETLTDFIRASDEVLDGSETGVRRFRDMLALTDDLTGAERADFFRAASNAGAAGGEKIDRFIKMAGSFTGEVRKAFLETSATISGYDHQQGTSLFTHFLDTTKRISQGEYGPGRETEIQRPSALFNTLDMEQQSYVKGFFGSAARISEYWSRVPNLPDYYTPFTLYA
ncbi:MAG: hypothetical protein MI802_28155 [Desulfobacterales bacterium]|nr:hypothetical protein [Desulfobacterales bacterium]